MKSFLKTIKAILVDLACEDQLPLDMNTFDETLLEPASKNLIAPVKWEQVKFGSDPALSLNGYVNGKLMFTIDQEGKRKPVYQLQSYPFRNDIFTKANNTKKLFKHEDIEVVKAKADEYLKQFVNFFLKQ